MCLTQAATVLSCSAGEAVVDVDGRSLRVQNLIVPELRPGDEVIVGLGVVLARVSPAEARELRRLRRQALDPPQPARAAAAFDRSTTREE